MGRTRRQRRSARISRMKANCFILATGLSFMATGAFGDSIFTKAKPQGQAVAHCYRTNIVKFATQTCEPASTVLDAAYGECLTEEKDYVDTVIRLGTSGFADDAPERIRAIIRDQMRQMYLPGVLNVRIKFGLCVGNSN